MDRGIELGQAVTEEYQEDADKIWQETQLKVRGMIIRELHEDANKYAKAAVKAYIDGKWELYYNLTDNSKSLRTIANHLDGVAAS